MAEKIVVTAQGIITALGYGVDANLQALRLSRSGLRYATHLQTIHSADFVLGEVDMCNDALAAMVGLPIGDNGYTRTALLALAAVHELLGNIPRSLLADDSFAFINANTVGGMCSVEDMYLDFLSPEQDGYFKKYIDTLDCAASTLHITSHFGLKPLSTTISTACSSSANALILGARMIQHGIVDRAICGGCDALSRFTLNGFHSLKNVDKAPCRPFDQSRFGLNLGEGAGYVLLERESDAKARGANIIATLSGYSNTNDAYHPTAPSPDGSGAARTIQYALDMAGLQANEVGYINAHGTATQNNDSAEGKAIQQLFGADACFSSTKPFTGHTLAAAGVVEAIFSMMALTYGIAIPNLNHEVQMEELQITPVKALQENLPLQHVLSNSFGFGGSNVSLIFSKL
jgi:3-oxoacyl-[acyl-carrier-protein] synthase-1